MTTLELIVRTSACTAALILAVALARARHASLASKLFGPALCVGVAAYLACSSATPICSSHWLRPLALLAIAAPLPFRGSTVSIMEDDFKLSPPAIAAGVLLPA